uniref:Uncharacterized protein n=1 Tax=viral metagenome TaxID=1070528 RepID=A0A6M3JJD6_9ZZZZ
MTITINQLQEHDLREKAAKSKNCLDWIPICNADCCRLFTLEINGISNEEMQTKIFKGEILTLRKICTKDQALYYKIHGVKYKHGLITIDTNIFRSITLNKKSKKFEFRRDCDWLIGTLCKEHDTGRKPEICKIYAETKPNKNKNIHVISKCLANYKEDGVRNEEYK